MAPITQTILSKASCALPRLSFEEPQMITVAAVKPALPEPTPVSPAFPISTGPPTSHPHLQPPKRSAFQRLAPKAQPMSIRSESGQKKVPSNLKELLDQRRNAQILPEAEASCAIGSYETDSSFDDPAPIPVLFDSRTSTGVSKSSTASNASRKFDVDFILEHSYSGVRSPVQDAFLRELHLPVSDSSAESVRASLHSSIYSMHSSSTSLYSDFAEPTGMFNARLELTDIHDKYLANRDKLQDAQQLLNSLQSPIDGNFPASIHQVPATQACIKAKVELRLKAREEIEQLMLEDQDYALMFNDGLDRYAQAQREAFLTEYREAW